MESVMKVGHESTVVEARESKCGKVISRARLKKTRRTRCLGGWSRIERLEDVKLLQFLPQTGGGAGK